MRLTDLAKPLHIKSRQEKLRLFFEEMTPSPSHTLLDVGGGLGISEEFRGLYDYFAQVAVANLEVAGLPAGSSTRFGAVAADGCRLPFPSKSFDYVFCNAVIEHVGPHARQKLLAQDVRRVTRRGYFVATPNRYFPIDPHTFLPLYHLMPASLQRFYIKLSPGYLREHELLTALSPQALKKLFPDASIVGLGPSMLPTSLIALGRRH